VRFGISTDVQMTRYTNNTAIDKVENETLADEIILFVAGACDKYHWWIILLYRRSIFHSHTGRVSSATSTLTSYQDHSYLPNQIWFRIPSILFQDQVETVFSHSPCLCISSNRPLVQHWQCSTQLYKHHALATWSRVQQIRKYHLLVRMLPELYHAHLDQLYQHHSCYMNSLSQLGGNGQSISFRNVFPFTYRLVVSLPEPLIEWVWTNIIHLRSFQVVTCTIPGVPRFPLMEFFVARLNHPLTTDFNAFFENWWNGISNPRYLFNVSMPYPFTSFGSTFLHSPRLPLATNQFSILFLRPPRYKNITCGIVERLQKVSKGSNRLLAKTKRCTFTET